jgi:hypothetical protein
MFLNSSFKVICQACIDDRLISIRHQVNPVLFHNSLVILMEDCHGLALVFDKKTRGLIMTVLYKFSHA